MKHASSLPSLITAFFHLEKGEKHSPKTLQTLAITGLFRFVLIIPCGHNYATMLYTAGVDPLIAMRLLGHTNYSTTARIYTHLNKTHIKQAAGQINGMFSKNKVAEKLPE